MIIDTSRKVNFGVYQGTTLYKNCKKTTGIYKGYTLNINEVKDHDKMIEKVYFLSDKMGNWIKSKIKYYNDGKNFLTVRSTGK